MKLLVKSLLTLLFLTAGIIHELKPQFFLKVMPPFLPYPLALIYISGSFEILGGIGLWISSIQVLVGYALVALLVAVFPVNIYMAIHPETVAELHMASFWWWLRLPLQFVLIAAVWWVSHDRISA